jgi:hypothetical protein
MARRTHEDFKTTAPAVNEHCLMVPFFQNAGSLLSLGFVTREGNCKSSSHAWQRLIDPHEGRMLRFIDCCRHRVPSQAVVYEWITSQLSALQFKDLAWKENRSRSPLTRITSTLLSVTTALFGGSPFRPMAPPGNSCRASRNHPASLRVPDSDGVLLQNSLRSIGRSCRSILRSKGGDRETPFAMENINRDRL